MSTKSSASIYTCKNCGKPFTGNYCNHCGEKLYTHHDKSLGHILEEVLHFLTHFEGKFLTTFKTIFTKPGLLSKDYCYGIRKKYFKPISFFLMIVILYLLFPVLEGLNMRLRYHLQHPMYSEYAVQVTEAVQRKHSYSDEKIAEVFSQKGEKISKFLLFILLPVLAFVSYLLARKQRSYFFDHFIFSTELISFFIMFGYLIVPIINAVFRWLGLYIIDSELSLSVFISTFSLIYITLATKRFFDFSLIKSIGFALVFYISLQLFLQFLYKFILFSIVIRMV